MKRITKITYPTLALFALVCFAFSPQARADCREGCLSANNTVLGDDALVNNFLGGNNTAVGFEALLNNTNGSYNTANGYQALLDNTVGISNTATGSLALHKNTTGSANTAIGGGALLNNIIGTDNTAIGNAALELNRGNSNTATGGGAMSGNQTGTNNTASGHFALGLNNLGNYNTATGDSALLFNETGSNNTANGANALYNTGGNNNIALGANAGLNLTTGDDNIDIGNAGVAGESGVIRIGTAGTHHAAVIAGVSKTISTGQPVVVNQAGRLGIIASSARFKDKIKPMDKASEAILALRPVTFHYKHQLDPDGIPQFGLVAEEVEKISPELVTYDDQGKPYSVRYEAVNAMLLNEFIKEHQTVQELKKQVAELTADLQKVSAQIEVSKSGPQTLVGNTQ